MRPKKTIFIPIANRQQARNVLRTDILNTLLTNQDTRLVLFVPHFKLAVYQREYVDARMVWIGVDETSLFFSFLDALFGRLALFYIDSPTGRFLRRSWLFLERRKPFSYGAAMLLSFILGHSRILRAFFRFLDYRLIRDNRYAAFFEKYKPDLIFSPRIDSTLDSSFLRHARRRKIMTIGMISAWDNITYSKYPFRVLPDKLIAYNEIIKNEAVRYLDIKRENIYVSGWPHFDHYVKNKRISREVFCLKLNIPLPKKIILFASNGRSGVTEWQVLAMLDQAIGNRQIKGDVIILVRHHPAADLIRGGVEYSDNIVFDNSKTLFREGGRSFSEILIKDMDHLADTLFYSEVMISTCSTMSIDAAVFDKPIINLAFDGWEKKPFHQSIVSAYRPNHAHYQPIIKTGGVKIAYSLTELIGFINLYLENPSLDSAGRQMIVREQCWQLDGHSGKRIGEYLLSSIGVLKR